MATSTTNLSITKITTGDETGTWGGTTNDNWDIVDAIFGSGGTAVSMGVVTADQVIVDNLGINGNTISATSGAINITPFAGSAIVLDSTINVDAGVVTGATSITSTNLVGAIDGILGGVTPAAATVTSVTVDGNGMIVTGTAAASGRFGNQIDADFTSDGSGATAGLVYVSGTVTGANGDTGQQAVAWLGGGVTTQSNTETVALATQLYVQTPNITEGTDTITAASTVYIDGAPTEATSNYALWVDDGKTQLDGDVDIGGAASVTGTSWLKANVGVNVAPDVNYGVKVGSMTSGGTSNRAALFRAMGTLTGASGDTTGLFGIRFDGSIVTQTATESITDIAALYVRDPLITDNLTGTITNASTVKIDGAPTEGTNNYGLWVIGGTMLDGDLGFYGTAPIAQQTGVAVTAGGIHAALVSLGLITA